MITAPRGTEDLLPPRSARWHEIEEQFRFVASSFGFGEIRTPMFESTELFLRGVGETTDIVEKEMYTFIDKGDRSMSLRPEWTAPVVRAMLEHKRLGQDAQRLFYVGPFFRYERPQAGRLRQAHQFGVESFGSASPEADVEVIALAMQAIAAVGLQGITLGVNSIGDPQCRAVYREALLAHFRPHLAQLSEDSQRRLERNPLRILDSKAREDQEFIATAPTLHDALCGDCRTHFTRVCELLTTIGVPYTVNPRLVRGFDYYTRTVFEVSATQLGAQSAVCGGGRYDGLVAQLGGPATPAVGFGMGIERILLALEHQAASTLEAPRAGIQAIALGSQAKAVMFALIDSLRRSVIARGQGPAVFTDYGDRKILAHYKIGDRNLARLAIVLGEDELVAGELIVRDLLTRDEERISLRVDNLADAVLAHYFRRASQTP